MPNIYRVTAESNLTITCSCIFDNTLIEKSTLLKNLHKSILRHFAGANKYPFYFEGDERNRVMDSPIRVELRIDGPFISKWSKTATRIYYEVNILITVNEQLVSFQDDVECISYMIKFFTPRITVFDENDNVIGCLAFPRDRVREQVEVNNYGRIKEDTPVIQATIEAHYIFDWTPS